MKYGFCRRVCTNLDLIGRRFAKQIHRDEAKRNRDEFSVWIKEKQIGFV
ncbi:hypothetical protein GPK75_07830 [[Eubacterium] rectale]|nr:hypothetical protein [Agathobacter rectalis]MBT9700979.1 hypothetical protein [Agathobacter rectalis]MCH3947091.1 hypothetical protein [Lachnospiraceae bacterium]MCI2085104.1 hypothetical protein [Lachnospiraceae bacterium]MCI2091764.1 hypothetical protein [Lachnospiraceae bacterium]